MFQENDEIRKDREINRALAIQTVNDDLIWLMGDARGRRYVYRIIESSGLYKSSYATDNQTYFNEGQRMVALRIISELKAITPENYIVMLQEHLNDR